MATAGEYEIPHSLADSIAAQIAEQMGGATPPPATGKQAEADGSVWRLHFKPGETPTEKELLDLHPALLKATLVVAPGDVKSHITPQK